MSSIPISRVSVPQLQASHFSVFLTHFLSLTIFGLHQDKLSSPSPGLKISVWYFRLDARQLERFYLAGLTRIGSPPHTRPDAQLRQDSLWRDLSWGTQDPKASHAVRHIYILGSTPLFWGLFITNCWTTAFLGNVCLDLPIGRSRREPWRSFSSHC